MQTTTFFALAALFSTALSHMEMSYPPPLRSKYNKLATNVDYSMTSPLSGAAQFPCKGYQADLGTPAGASVETFAPGQKFNFTINGGAPHGGGSCQAALSYDQGKTFTVITSYIGGCPLSDGATFDTTIPSDAPTGAALFAWTWYNQIGNREIYQNCASITIGGGSSKRGSSSVAYASRPGMFVANVDNGCTTVEGTDLVFPDPGPDVVGSTSASGTLVGTCAAVNGVGGSSVSGSGSGSSAPASGSSPVASASPAAPASPVASSAQASAAVPTTMSTLVSSSTPSAAAASPPGGVFATSASSGDADPTAVATPASSAVVPAATSPAASPVASTQPASSTGTSATGAVGSQTGACTSEGMFNCIDGKTYQQCASGVWSVVMNVASGTSCTTGESMSLDIGFANKQRRTVRRRERKFQ